MSENAPPHRVKRSVNAALAALSGYQLTKVNAASRRSGKARANRTAATGERQPVDRLVTRPTFVIAAPRAGSSQLAALLDRHAMICAPREVHLRFVTAEGENDATSKALGRLGIDQAELDYLLWDRLLERALTASRKRVLVERAPSTPYVWKRLRDAWPAARYLYLLRHPAAVAESLARSRKVSVNDVVHRVLDQGASVNAARVALPGPTIRYEDLVADPAQVTKEVCACLDLAWEPTMLVSDGAGDAGGHFTMRFDGGQAPYELPPEDRVHPLLRDLSRSWGYLS